MLFLTSSDSFVLGFVSLAFYLLGFICAIVALWRARTPQGAAAWVVGLLAFPFLVVPFFLIFGRNKFVGYTKERRHLEEEAQKEISEIDNLYKEQVSGDANLKNIEAVVEILNQPGFTSGNEIQLLVDGKETFQSMLTEIEKAEKYILIQFYIFEVDQIGRKFLDLLIKKSLAGVRVYFLYDGVGIRISGSFLKELRRAGVKVGVFNSTKGWSTRFQINFRNHRKLVVVDGVTAFVGGFNVGDEYLGRSKKLGPWRDTHVKLAGPSALAAQLSFAKDWYWVKEEVPNFDWEPKKFEKDSKVLVLHTGPADGCESGLFAHLSLFSSARERIWIANPYFLPPEGLSSSLALAAIRGLDVRVLVPSYSDNALVMRASEIQIERLIKFGVKFYRYMPGFLHQKVILIDEASAVVGSSNLDPRSIFINFEIMAITSDRAFVSEVKSMLEDDFSTSEEILENEFLNRSFWRQLTARAANLFAPML